MHIERLLARNLLPNSVGRVFHFINCLLVIILPVIQILLAPSMPMPAFATLILVIAYFLKVWSYAHANRWYRTEAETKAKEKANANKMVYPNNLTERVH